MQERVFKTAWFAKAAIKASISDQELCKAAGQVMLGQAEDLGGGVYKKRLSRNSYRSIILAKGGNYWVYEYLFAKKDRSNIDGNELEDFRQVARAYCGLTDHQIGHLLADGDLMEICYGNGKKI